MCRDDWFGARKKPVWHNISDAPLVTTWRVEKMVGDFESPGN